MPGLERLLWPYNIALAVLYFASGARARRTPVVAVSRRMDPVLSVRIPNQVTLKIENLTDAPLTVRLRDEAPEDVTPQGNEFEVRLKPSGETERSYALRPAFRGEYRLPGTFVRYAAPFGLAWVDVHLDNAETIDVYPNVKAVRDFELLKQKGFLRSIGARQTRLRGLGTEFESLRDYNEDDFRFIDWKSTARRGRLVVKNFEQERNQSVIVCLDVGRLMLAEVEGVRKLDHAVDAALMLLHAAESSGDQVGLFVFSDVVHNWVAPKRGRTQVAALLRALFAVQSEAVQANYNAAFAYLASRWKRRSLVVVFTDAENEDQAADLAAALGPIRRRHLLYIVRVADPRLKELLALPVEGSSALYRRAAATWYAADRRQADSRLRASNLQSLEAEPQDLAAALVNAYLTVKRKALI